MAIHILAVRSLLAWQRLRSVSSTPVIILHHIVLARQMGCGKLQQLDFFLRRILERNKRQIEETLYSRFKLKSEISNNNKKNHIIKKCHINVTHLN